MAQLGSTERLVGRRPNSCAKPIVLSSHSGMRRASGPMPVAAAINGSSGHRRVQSRRRIAFAPAAVCQVGSSPARPCAHRRRKRPGSYPSATSITFCPAEVGLLSPMRVKERQHDAIRQDLAAIIIISGVMGLVQHDRVYQAAPRVAQHRDGAETKDPAHVRAVRMRKQAARP